jgi:DUF4097 and DUF4098 domain-containing protein YvlB
MWDLGGPQFGLADVKIGTKNGAGTYAGVVTVPSVQALGVSIETVNAKLEGNDRITATAAKAISGSVTLRMGSVSIDVLKVIAGGNASSSGTTPNIYKAFKVTNRKYPAIGLCGKANAEEGAGDMHLFIPNAKVREGFEVRFEYGNFAIPELTLDLTPDTHYADSEGYATLFIPIAHETAIPVALPPAGV